MQLFINRQTLTDWSNIILDKSQPLGNRLQMISARIYLMLQAAGTHRVQYKDFEDFVIAELGPQALTGGKISIYDAAKKAWNAARNHSPEVSEQDGWIPVGDGLPPPNPDNNANSVDVMFFPNVNNKGNWALGRLWYSQGAFIGGNEALGFIDDPFDKAQNVTHWRPLVANPIITK